MNGFERRKEKKKEDILRAALDLFRVHGFKKVSINDIALKSGASPVTIYNHFGSKDRLVQEVVKAQFKNMVEKYRLIIDGEGSFPEKLESIVFDKTSIISQFQGELVETLFRNDPEMQRFVEELWVRDSTRLTLDLLEKGRREGFISEERSPQAIMLYLEILRSGLSARPEMLAKLELTPEFCRELNNIFLYGLVGKTAVPGKPEGKARKKV
ncbi:MAG: TetR/AcrR family transcriptional regulator [Dehalococcoidia bacterium]|nr:TetR/AcrR family transcriptional regulator [Dehalococcoidia bacterium]